MKSLFRRFCRLISSIKPLRMGLRFLSMRGLLPAFIHKRLPVEDTFKVQISNTESFLYASTYGDQTGRVLYWEGKGGIDPETLEYFDKEIRKARTFADVGANVGHFTLYAAAINPELEITSFEPVQRTNNHLSGNIAVNKWQKRCKIMHAAVGAEDGTIDLHIPYDELPFSASLNQDGFNDIEGELVKTKILRLDSYYKDTTPPDFIKIDVEGFEHQVLEGCAGLFEGGARPGIILECNPGGPEQQITDILQSYGYELFQLRDTGPLLCKTISTNEGDRYRNWAAISKQAA